MTSHCPDLHYASITLALFEHVEQDLLQLTTALLDDDEDEHLVSAAIVAPSTSMAPQTEPAAPS